MTHSLILLRHGQSTWNQENLFTGWYDADLSDQGRDGPAGTPKEAPNHQGAGGRYEQQGPHVTGGAKTSASGPTPFKNLKGGR